jgi:cytochrome c1
MLVRSKLVEEFKMAFVFVLVSGAIIFTSCNQEQERVAAAITGGNPQRGKAALSKYGCSTCHTIPGVRGADALVGPPLTQMGSRSYIAGVLPNTPGNMMRWIEDPLEVDRLTAMPNLGVTDTDARDISSYLYSLK